MGVTTKDLAAACGVSRTTVNRALNNSGTVKPETREMILAKAKEMGYVPDLVAKSLASGNSHVIGIIVVDLRNPYYAQIVNSVSQRAKSRGYMVNICTHEDDKAMEKNLIRMMKGYRSAGLILNCINKNEKFQQWLDSLGIPYVILGYKFFPNSHTVGVDEEEAGRAAVRLMKSHGYRNLVFVAPPMYDADQEVNIPHGQRNRGFSEEAEKQGCTHRTFVGDDAYEQVLEFMRENRDGKPAFLCSGEIYAISLQSCLEKYGYKTPDDFGMMTYDKLIHPLWDKDFMAAIDNSVEQMGATAADTLLDLIEGIPVQKDTEIPYEIADGKSL